MLVVTSKEDADIDKPAIDLIKRLLTRDPKKRLGCGGTPDYSIEKLKAHPFFESIDFKSVFTGKGPKTSKPGSRLSMTEDLASHASTSFSSSMNCPSMNSGMIQKEVLSVLDTKRKKFLFVEVDGRLYLYNDYTLRYDQIYDNSTVEKR
jgi:serine/threonine protein kinase